MQNEIINKIAEWLQISVEKAVELYPQLRMEAVWYSVMNNVSTILLCSGVGIIIFMFVDYMNYTMDSYRDEVEVKKSAGRRLKTLAKLFNGFSCFTINFKHSFPVLISEHRVFQTVCKVGG